MFHMFPVKLSNCCCYKSFSINSLNFEIIERNIKLHMEVNVTKQMTRVKL